ncbi:LAFA_0A07294g1_1 [Lachancea sp. 'fantastica']|nr:LAFA_0A07294g1_1 [Lachancea sp. 'fantastica']
MDYSIVRKNESLALSKWTAQDQILLKVGMTRKTNVLARLLEWENSCKHPVTGIDLSKVNQLYRASHKRSSSSLVRLFQKMSLSDRSRGTVKIRGFRDGGFYVANGRSLELIETQIHQLLWNRYGQGLIYCYGCNNHLNQPKRHREWFMVPLDHVPDIFRAIGAICNGS